MYVQHQEWDLERPDPAGYHWHRPQAEVARFLARMPARRVEWELTGRIVGGRGPLAVRAWWDPHPVLLAAPPRWETLLEELANSAGRDAAARSTWLYPTSPQTGLDEMARAVNDRLEPGQPPWPLPRGCALLAYAEHGQDEGYRSAVQFVCKNAGVRDRVLAAAREFNAWLPTLAACRSSEEFLTQVAHWAATYPGPAVPAAGAGGAAAAPEDGEAEGE